MPKTYHCAQCEVSNTGSNAVQLQLVKGVTWKGKPCILCDKHFRLLHEISLRGRTPIVIEPVFQ